MEAIDWNYLSANCVWRDNLMKELLNTGVEVEAPELRIWRDIYDDSVSLESYWYTLLSPKFRQPAFLAMRITLFAALPLLIIGDKFADHFTMSRVLCLYGIAYSQETLGEQICMLCTAFQVVVCMTVWGLLMYTFNVLNHEVAWWCAVFFGSFFVGLFGDLRCRRLSIVMMVIIMEVQRSLPNQGGPYLPFYVARDVCFALMFSFAQAFLPPFTMCKRVDDAMAGAWVYMGSMVQNCVKGCWAENPIDAAAAISKTSSEPLQAIFTVLPPQLNVVRYEPWVSPLLWQLRNERIKVMGGLMPMLHALAAAVRTLHTSHVAQKDLEGWKNPGVETVRGRLEEALEPYLKALEETLKGLGHALKPEDVAEKLPLEDLHAATSGLQSSIDKIHYDMMKGRLGNVDSVWYMYVVFAHLMMVLFGEELLRYGEAMRNFDSTRYTSASRRMWDFFIFEYWNDFWTELPKRLTLATPRDVRVVKDAFKLACGYTVASVFTLYVGYDRVFYFGMAILMGVGLPTAGDTLMAGIQRVAGLVFAASFAYLIKKHKRSEAEVYALSLLLIMVSLFARVFPGYFHCAFYCALLISSMLHIATVPLMMFSRVVSSSLAVMSYYVIVVFVFPIDTIRVLHNAEVWIMNGVSEYLSSLVRLLQFRVGDKDAEVMQELLAVKGRSGGLWVAVRQLLPKVKTAGLEPTIRGKPYPVYEQEEFAQVLRRLLSSLDIMLLGLMILHRERVVPAAAELEEMLGATMKVVKGIERYGVYVMQDFVNAVQQPETWSYVETVDHFTTLLRLNNQLKDIFSVDHGKMLSAIRGKANELHLNNLKLSMAFASNSSPTFPLPTEDMRSEPNQSSTTACPYGLEGEGKAREELTAPRNASFMLRPDEFTINHDMNMSIAVLVGMDLFCSELVKSMRTMQHINQFELSRRQ
ncbi:uncharacterized protein Tco025E_04944 [Trypanosoma conorhini]|uniref:Uncharacterized protein n=1 Tax=Trypanosoma conorhini TaxID=83891 RepID=A0A422PHB2_9TRYP|nr:uncharacterized protein Tco025E_04944 [Trypanosoma conorhini]RNF17091.1 hypothetical protein Tco025E_04944 [Trypanosoma conorhini]